MHIDSKKLNEVAALMEDHGLTRVRLSEEDGRVVELERMSAPAPEAIAVPVAAPVAAVTPATSSSAPAAVPIAPAAAPADAATPAAEAAPAPVDAPGTVAVNAPMVGVFYAAPSPGAEPFVTVGSQVHAGDTLCIIEAMKLMNEVVAETDGTIAEICAEDGDLVEFGSCLMKIAPGGEA